MVFKLTAAVKSVVLGRSKSAPTAWRQDLKPTGLLPFSVRIIGGHAGQGRVVGAGDGTIHGRRCGVARQLGVDACWGGFAVHLQLQGVQGRLVGFARQPSGEARVQSCNAVGVVRPSAAAKSEAKA